MTTFKLGVFKFTALIWFCNDQVILLAGALIDMHSNYKIVNKNGKN